MKNSKNIQTEVEKTLKSLDNWQGVETDPFFYTRLSVKLEKRAEPNLFSWLFDSPVLRPALIAIALLVNILSISYYISTSNSYEAQSNDFVSLFTEEYMLDQSTESYIVYNYE